ncbi:MAG: carboxypeptidase regulatory-like domain-containing protein [Chlorobiaceae bacterium]|nr:carboxypeptidase regulatory-like domain-containing protein [Chlorobiaceae bacterium]
MASLLKNFSNDDILARLIQWYIVFVSAFFWLFSQPVLADINRHEDAVPLFQANSFRASQSKGKSLLVGIYVAKRYCGNTTVQFVDEEFWVPWKKFLSLAGFPASAEHDGLVTFATTIGNILFDTGTLRNFDGQLYVSFNMLDEVFRVFPTFDQSLFAIKFRISWQPASSASTITKVLTPDVSGPGTSLAFIHAQYQHSNDFRSSTYRNLDMQFGGRAAGGVWDIELQGDPDIRIDPCHYHWTALTSHMAFRVGTANSESSSLLAAQKFTGMQIGWSNNDITPYFDQPFYSTQDAFMIFNTAQQRNIEGKGPPAGIAELRFDGKIAARQTILLDGRFSFPKVQMGMDFRRTEVYLYRSSILEKPVTVLDFTQSVSSRALEPNTVLASCGIGMTGNPLLRSHALEGPGKPIAYGHVQYGLNKWLTLETATQASKEINGCDMLAGAVLSIGSKWNVSAYAASSNQQYGTDLNIERRGKNSDLLIGSTHYDREFGSDLQPQMIRQSLRYTWSALKNFNLSLIGRREESIENSVTYLRPGGSIFFKPGFRLSVTPDYDQHGDLRYEAAYFGSDLLTANMAYDSKKLETTVSWQSASQLNLRFSSQYYVLTKDAINTAYLDWYIGGARNTLIEFVASHSKNQTGASISFRRAAQTGFDIALSYQYNIPNTLQLDIDQPAEYNPGGKHSFFCTLTWDFGWSGKSFKPINRSSLMVTRGGIAVAFLPETESTVEMKKVRDIGILVNGYKMPQNKRNGSCFIGNLKPGLYNVCADPESLPVYVNPDKKAKIVEVRGCQITKVDIPLHAEYGISGQLTDGTGRGIPGSLVMVRGYDQKEPAGSGVTNDFGYYRIDSLRNGHYVVFVQEKESVEKKNLVERPFEVSGKYLFDIDMSIPAVSSPDANELKEDIH